MPAATSGTVDPIGPWRPLDSKVQAARNAAYQTPSMDYSLTAKTVSPASRPIRWSASKHNQESLDAEEHRLAMQNDRTAHKYGPHQHWRDQHWDGLAAGEGQEAVLGGANVEGLRDRGKAHASFESEHGRFNPMKAQWEVAPACMEAAEFALVPGAKKKNLSRQAQYGPATCGQYDPILHTWIAPPDETAWRERERQHQHEIGVNMDGHVRNNYGRGTYDPIRNEWLSLPEGTVEQGAGQRSRQEEAEWLNVKTARRMANTQHRTGIWDPLRNKWVVQPSQAEEADEQMRLKAHGEIPIKRKVPPSANCGVYDPIRNEWTVYPANPRIIEGRTFAPR